MKRIKEQLPSNDDGRSKSYFDIKVKDYQAVSDKKDKKAKDKKKKKAAKEED